MPEANCSHDHPSNHGLSTTAFPSLLSSFNFPPSLSLSSIWKYPTHPSVLPPQQNGRHLPTDGEAATGHPSLKPVSPAPVAALENSRDRNEPGSDSAKSPVEFLPQPFSRVPSRQPCRSPPTIWWWTDDVLQHPTLSPRKHHRAIRAPADGLDCRAHG